MVADGLGVGTKVVLLRTVRLQLPLRRLGVTVPMVSNPSVVVTWMVRLVLASVVLPLSSQV
ncbi:hypothetical protein D3C85_1917330 [compost metagenome]